jgi:hypothetical protein
MKAPEYRKLCREIHRKYGKVLDLPYWESCSVADSINEGEFTKQRVFELMDMAVEDLNGD